MMTGNFSVPKFETIAKCANLTGLAKYHIRQLVLNQRVKFIKTGKKYLVQLDSLIEYLATCEPILSKEKIIKEGKNV